MKKIIEKEMLKRKSAETLKYYSSLNWIEKKARIKKIMEEVFKDLKIDEKSFNISDSLNDQFSSVKYRGYDILQVSHPSRFTGNSVITREYNKEDNSLKSSHFDRKREVGASLTITTSALGLYDVFLNPAENGDKITTSEEILIFNSNTADALTDKRVKKFIRLFLIFQRVDSLFERAGKLDKFIISYYRFFDPRNKEKYWKIIHKESRHWGAVFLAVGITIWVAKPDPATSVALLKNNSTPSISSSIEVKPTQHDLDQSLVSMPLPAHLITKLRIPSRSTKDEYDGNLSITLKTNLEYTNQKIDISINQIGAKHKYFNQLSIGDKVNYGNYEVMYTHIEKDHGSYYACFKIIKV